MQTNVILHQTHHQIADFSAIRKSLTNDLGGDGLHIFPELFLTGYPLQDLVLQKGFIDTYQDHLQQIHEWARALPGVGWRALVGGLEYTCGADGVPEKIKNVIFEITPGKGLKAIYTKRLLPNYDIFDEQKYFTAGSDNSFYSHGGLNFGLQICEDMWASSFHSMDPCVLMLNEVKAKNIKLHAIINLSASPFEAAKKLKRHERARNISLLFGVPFI